VTVWFAIPSKRDPATAETYLNHWRERGYKIALWRDQDDPAIAADFTATAPVYPGYHGAINGLARCIRSLDLNAEWIVTGGDDMLPDPNKTAEEIGAECSEHFKGSFGVMQPTGDKWAGSDPGAICGSPWMGREFCRRMYGGKGPFCEAYPHMWGDEEMHIITSRLGILWNRPDLTHFHGHFRRNAGFKLSQRPSWMVRNDECYTKYKPLFEARKRAGFPGHEPIA
jgi:hypothetical protein